MDHARGQNWVLGYGRTAQHFFFAMNANGKRISLCVTGYRVSIDGFAYCEFGSGNGISLANAAHSSADPGASWRTEAGSLFRYEQLCSPARISGKQTWYCGLVSGPSVWTRFDHGLAGVWKFEKHARRSGNSVAWNQGCGDMFCGRMG
jgi:hypothetical protein